MTIPDLGHCAGSGAAPREGTVEQGDPATAVCAACSGRFPLTEDGSLSFHESAGRGATGARRATSAVATSAGSCPPSR